MGAGNGPGKPLRGRDKVLVVDGFGLCTRTGQALGRVVHIDALVHWAGFLFRYVIPKRSPEEQMFTVTLVPHTLKAGALLPFFKLGTTTRSSTGCSSPITCRYGNGTRIVCNIGGYTIPS